LNSKLLHKWLELIGQLTHFFLYFRFLIALLVYFVGGIFYNRMVHHASGVSQIPNSGFWKEAWYFVRVSEMIGTLLTLNFHFRAVKIISVILCVGYDNNNMCSMLTIEVQAIIAKISEYSCRGEYPH